MLTACGLDVSGADQQLWQQQQKIAKHESDAQAQFWACDPRVIRA